MFLVGGLVFLVGGLVFLVVGNLFGKGLLYKWGRISGCQTRISGCQTRISGCQKDLIRKSKEIKGNQRKSKEIKGNQRKSKELTGWITAPLDYWTAGLLDC